MVGIYPYTTQQLASRIAADFPVNWAGSDAEQSGQFSVLLEALGQGLEDVLQEILYAADAARITTATSPELDTASLDFFGPLLPRPNGMSDQAYAVLIISNLLQTAATRPAIQSAIQRLAGVTPRMMEPKNIFDCGVWGKSSYWKVDTVQNPARWGSPGSVFQGFIETAAPAITPIGPNNPILCWGTTAYWDVPGYFMGVISTQSAQQVDQIVNSLKAEGTTVWIKIVSATTLTVTVAPGIPTSLVLTSQSSSTITAAWAPPAVGTPPLTYLVQFRVTGTLTWVTGPTVGVPSALISGLQPFTNYDVQVAATNSAGSSVFSSLSVQQTSKNPPSPATNLVATLVQTTAITVTWSEPTSGTLPFTYNLQYRVTGTATWNTLFVGGAIGATILGLQPNTAYDIEVVTSNT